MSTSHCRCIFQTARILCHLHPREYMKITVLLSPRRELSTRYRLQLFSPPSLELHFCFCDIAFLSLALGSPVMEVGTPGVVTVPIHRLAHVRARPGDSLHAGSDQHCISAVVQGNSIPLCMTVEEAFHSPILRAPRESRTLLSGGDVRKDRRQIYPACLQHYKPVSHADSKL